MAIPQLLSPSAPKLLCSLAPKLLSSQAPKLPSSLRLFVFCLFPFAFCLLSYLISSPYTFHYLLPMLITYYFFIGIDQ